MKYKDFFDLVESDEDIIGVDEELGLDEEKEEEEGFVEEVDESIFDT